MEKRKKRSWKRWIWLFPVGFAVIGIVIGTAVIRFTAGSALVITPTPPVSIITIAVSTPLPITLTMTPATVATDIIITGTPPPYIDTGATSASNKDTVLPYDPCRNIEDPAFFEYLLRIELPQDIGNFQSICSGIRNWNAEAHFDMNPDEFAKFLATTRITDVALTDELPSQIFSAWRTDIEKLNSVKYGLYVSGEWHQEIVVDTSNPERWVVYLAVIILP